MTHSTEGFRSCIVLGCIAMQVVGASACVTREKPNRQAINAQKNMPSQSTTISDSELTALIKTFSEDMGPEGQAAWRKLQSYPREDLIKSVLALRASLGKDDPRRYSIAFVLCNFDYEYSANVKQVVSALTSNGAHYYADSAATMLGRLVHRGDKDLLKVLFDAAPASDASLAEALSDAFSDELRSNPNEFLTQLKAEPKPIRLKVYKLIESGSLTAKDIESLRVRFQSLSPSAPTSRVARELLASSIFKN
jgi:hypothetical protein